MSSTKRCRRDSSLAKGSKEGEDFEEEVATELEEKPRAEEGKRKKQRKKGREDLKRKQRRR